MADVITVATGTVGSAGNVAADLITYMSARVLSVAELKMVLNQFGYKAPIPSNSSKTIRLVRVEKLAVSASPTQLTEGVTPDSIGLTLNQFEATAEQYGTVIRIADLAELTAAHDVVGRAIYVLGLQAAELYDQLIFNIVDAATNVYRPNSKTTDAGLVGTDRVSFVDLVSLLALHQDNGARPLSEGAYVFVTPPQVHAALLLDPDFKAAVAYGRPGDLYNGEVGRIAGLRVVVSNAPAFAPFTTTATGSADKVYSSFMIGEEAYAVSDLQNLRTYVARPGGQFDVLQQSTRIGWKFAFKAVITNQTWIRRIRSAGLNSKTN